MSANREVANNSSEIKVFISYSHKDSLALAQRLYHDLQAKGVNAWWDRERILGGDPWTAVVWEALKDCTNMVVVVSPEAVKSVEVEAEYNFFLLNGKPIIPLLFGLTQNDVPYRLSLYQSIDFSGDYYQLAFNRLVNDLRVPLPRTPATDLPLIGPEWAVDEAREKPEVPIDSDTSEFVSTMRDLTGVVAKLLDIDPVDVVITLYGRSFPEQVGVGKFEFDLLYYWNVSDPTLMFGPIIENDMRTNACGQGYLWYINPDPGGRFVERERIRSSSWFKLAEHLRDNELLDEKKSVLPSSVQGLLFVNTRRGRLHKDELHESSKFQKALAAVNRIIVSVIDRRRRQNDVRMGKLGRELPANTPVHRLAHVTASRDITPVDIHTFFSKLVGYYEDIIGKPDLAVTVLAYNNHKQQLMWLWSNGPTSLNASIELGPTNPNPNSLLAVQVAQDPAHRPRLVNYFQSNEFKDLLIITRHGSEARSNLIVPILSNTADKELLGIIDVQASTGTSFDTDDVQFAYELASRYGADFLSKIERPHDQQAATTLLDPAILGFNNPPLIRRQELGFNISKLVELNFSPMKYLFHWDKIRRIIAGQAVEFPALIEIWPSMVCDHWCTWCRTRPPRLDYEDTNPFIEWDGLFALASDLTQHDGIDLLISGGGEPLMHPRIHDFMKTLHEGNFSTVGIFTNGTRPTNFRFWEYFFKMKSRHSFVRVSFNGHEPAIYSQIHFPQDKNDPAKCQKHYAEARKIVLDLLAMRSDTCTVAIGSTVHSNWLGTIKEQVSHAQQLGVDFIQIRPELIQSAQGHAWRKVRKAVLEAKPQFETERFAVVYTDTERAYRNHDYNTCYAMYLVPAITPDIDSGQLVVWPCSYALNRVGRVPKLGLMSEGTTISQFWKALNISLGHKTAEPDQQPSGIYELATKPVDPSQGCPQCRYYMLNRRISEIKKKADTDKSVLPLISEFIQTLERDPDQIDEQLAHQIDHLCPAIIINGDEETKVIDVKKTQEAFKLSKQLGIRPSL